MNTTGHYDVRRMGPNGGGWISHLVCRHCTFTVNVRDQKHSGKSGQAKYNRARAKMVKHLHEAHRAQLAQPSIPSVAEPRSSIAERRAADFVKRSIEGGFASLEDFLP